MGDLVMMGGILGLFGSLVQSCLLRSSIPLPRDLHQVTSLVQPNDLSTVKLVQKTRKGKYYFVGTTYLIRVSMLSLYRTPLTCSPSKCVDGMLSNRLG